MVKELSMDNSIFAISAKGTDSNVTVSSGLSTEKFESVLKTAKNDTNYTDKTDLKTTNDKVVKVAEKSVSKEVHSSSHTATDVTKVSKKVSNNSTQSPKTATNTHSTSTTTKPIKTVEVESSEVSLSNDACTYSVKSELQATTTQENVEQTPVDSTAVVDDTVVTTLPQASEEEVEGLTEQLVETEENQDTTQQVLGGPIFPIPVPKVEIHVAVPKKMEALDAEVDSTAQELQVQSLDVEEENLSSESSIQLDKNWVGVDKEEAETILKEIESSLEQEQDVNSDDVKSYIKDSISLEDEKKSTEQSVVKMPESKNEVSFDVKKQESVPVDKEVANFVQVDEESNQVTGAAADVIEQENSIEVPEQVVKQDLDEEFSVDIKKNIDEKDELGKQKESVLVADTQDIEETAEASQSLEVVDNELEVEIVDEEPVVSTKNNFSVKEENSVEKEISLVVQDDIVEEQEFVPDVKTEYTTTQKVADAIEKVVTTTRPTVATKDEDDEEEDNNSVVGDLLLEEVCEVTETQDVEVEVELENNSELLLKEDKTFEKTNQEVSAEYNSEDLDLYIDNCVKLAFVDTTVQSTEEIDVISALETKYEDSYAQEEDVEIEFQDAGMEEYENISSLEELVDVKEVESLGLRLKASANSEPVVSSISTSTTTEQLIRYSIEGDNSSLNSTQTIEFAKFTPEVARQAESEISGKEILAQLSEKLSTFSFKAGSKLTMQLNPENLGKIELTLKNTTEGIIAEMTASSDDAADMLKKNIDDLKETLQKYGVRFDNVSVKTTATQQNAQNQDYTQQDSNQKQQQEQKRESERQDKKQFDEMMNSFTDEDKE